MGWKAEARAAIFKAVLSDPDAVPKYRMPTNFWWEFWKPRWEMVEGTSLNQMRRAHGFPPLRRE